MNLGRDGNNAAKSSVLFQNGPILFEDLFQLLVLVAVFCDKGQIHGRCLMKLFLVEQSFPIHLTNVNFQFRQHLCFWAAFPLVQLQCHLIQGAILKCSFSATVVWP